jgi:hypothetical protein
MRTENLFSSKKKFDPVLILHMLKDKAFFKEAVEILKVKGALHPVVWSYAFYHKDDEELMRECLQLGGFNSKHLGTHFKSSLFV